MLKRKVLQKIMVTTIALFALLLLYVIPAEVETRDTLKVEETLEYVDQNATSEIFLIDHNDYVARTMVAVNQDTDIESKVREIISILTIGSSSETKVPNGFKAIIPEGTTINSLLYENGLLKINFSKELLDVKKEDEEFKSTRKEIRKS